MQMVFVKFWRNNIANHNNNQSFTLNSEYKSFDGDFDIIVSHTFSVDMWGTK